MLKPRKPYRPIIYKKSFTRVNDMGGVVRNTRKAVISMEKMWENLCES